MFNWRRPILTSFINLLESKEAEINFLILCPQNMASYAHEASSGQCCCFPRQSQLSTPCLFRQLQSALLTPQGFLFTKFQDIVRLKFWKSWTFPHSKTISVYIDVNSVYLWYTRGQNVLLQNFGQQKPCTYNPDTGAGKLRTIRRLVVGWWRRLLAKLLVSE